LKDKLFQWIGSLLETDTLNEVNTLSNHQSICSSIKLVFTIVQDTKQKVKKY